MYTSLYFLLIISAMAFRAVLTLPQYISNNFLNTQSTATALQSLPNIQNSENSIQSLLQAFSLSNLQSLQSYTDAVSDPKLTKSQLQSTMSSISTESPQFGQQLTAANQKETNDWNSFTSQIRSTPNLSTIMANITTLHNNMNINLGEEVMQLLNFLMTLPTSTQYSLCQIVDGLTVGEPQFTVKGLASLATTCQTLETLYSQQGSLGSFIGGYGITSNPFMGNNMGGITGNGLGGMLGSGLNGFGGTLRNGLNGLTGNSGNTLSGFNSIRPSSYYPNQGYYSSNSNLYPQSSPNSLFSQNSNYYPYSSNNMNLQRSFGSPGYNSPFGITPYNNGLSYNNLYGGK